MFIVNHLGELAALSTAVAWSASAICSTSAGNRIGSFATTRYRTLVGFVVILAIHFILFQQFVPIVSNKQLWMLATSSIVGLVVGDTLLTQSYIDIGPRLTHLIFNLNPFFTTFIASLTLNEKLHAMSWLGIFITIVGTSWVVLEERNKKDKKHKNLRRGIIFTVFAALGQSVGYIMSKPVMTGNSAMDPLSTALVRMAIASFGFWAIWLLNYNSSSVRTEIKNKKAMLLILLSASTGPIGMWFSLIALKLVPAGIAATIIATLPVMVMPFTILIYKEKISWKAFIGALITIVGIAILFYFGSPRI